MTRPEFRWERSRNGVRFLRRHPNHALGIVRPNADGSFSWLTRAHDQGERPARYSTADEAMNVLCATLGLAA